MDDFQPTAPLTLSPGTEIPNDASQVIAPSEALGADVNVVSPDGEVGSIPQSQLEDALSAGYSHATPQQVDAHFRHEKYGTGEQMVKTALEGAATGLIGKTLTNLVEAGTGLAKPEDIAGREEENPYVHGISETGTFIGSALAGTGEAALLGRAGEALGAHLPQAGSFLAEVGNEAAKGAFEAILYQADQEGGKIAGDLGRTFKEDPETAAGHAIASIGLAGVMGGVFGGALGAIFRKGATGAGELAAGIPETEPAVFVSGADKAAFEAGDLKTHIAVDPALPEAKKASMLDAFKLNKQKPNAKEIEKAAETLGAPATPGMTLESPLIQMQLDSLAHSPYTYSGNKIRGVLDDAYGKAEGALQGATASANGLSKDELGQALQQSLSDDTRAAYAPVKAAFDEVAALHPNVPVNPEDIGAFRAGLKDIKEVALGPSTDEGKLARQVVNALQNAKTAEDLTVIRNMSALKKSGVGADPLGHIKGVLRDRLQGMLDDVTAKYAKSFPRNDEAGALMESLIGQDKAAKSAYAPYIKKVQELSTWLGKGKIHGTEDALNFMNERLSASDVSQRLFSASKDPQFLRFFGKEFPEQFKLVRDYQRMALRDAATTGEEFSPKVFFNKFNKLEPEVQKALYSADEIKKIDAAETYIRDAFPKGFNPSHTAHALALKEAYSSPKSMILANVRDSAMEGMIKLAEGSPQAQSAVSLAKSTIDGDKLANKAIKAVFSGAKEAMPASVISLAGHRAKLDKLVATYQADPSKALQQGDSNPVPEYAKAFSNTTGRAVLYLAALKPKNDPQRPLDTRIPPTQAQKAAYDRALDIAQQPLNVLHRIQSGTLTPADMKTLTAIYPQVYANLQQKVMSQIVSSAQKGQTIPYKTRLQLSMFMGQPLDSTMTQPAMQAIQGQAQQSKAERSAPPQQQAGRAPSASSVKGLGKIAQEAQTPGQSRQAARAARRD